MWEYAGTGETMAAEAVLTGVIIPRPDNANADIAKTGLNICLIRCPSKKVVVPSPSWKWDSN
jgi:hypothetical protein